mmetsp:Transcript_441/g.1147  ORF Transcript_441/g.1147 Transcript_441/m.1147 type:complete len:205 (-) Transcript_441:407-1021(-)
MLEVHGHVHAAPAPALRAAPVLLVLVAAGHEVVQVVLPSCEAQSVPRPSRRRLHILLRRDAKGPRLTRRRRAPHPGQAAAEEGLGRVRRVTLAAPLRLHLRVERKEEVRAREPAVSVVVVGDPGAREVLHPVTAHMPLGRRDAALQLRAHVAMHEAIPSAHHAAIEALVDEADLLRLAAMRVSQVRLDVGFRLEAALRGRGFRW